MYPTSIDGKPSAGGFRMPHQTVRIFRTGFSRSDREFEDALTPCRETSVFRQDEASHHTPRDDALTPLIWTTSSLYGRFDLDVDARMIFAWRIWRLVTRVLALPRIAKQGTRPRLDRSGNDRIRPDSVIIDGVDQDRSWIGSAVSGRRGAPPPVPRVAAPQRTRDNGPMTKSELIQRIAQKQPQIVERDAELAVKMMLDQIAACLASGGRIESEASAASRSVSAPREPLATPEPVRRCRFRPGTPLISSRGYGCASASIKGSRPLIPRSSPTAGEQCGRICTGGRPDSRRGSWVPAPKRDITPWELTTNVARQHPGDGGPGLAEASAGREMRPYGNSVNPEIQAPSESVAG